MNVLHKNERITPIRKDGSTSPWSIVFKQRNQSFFVAISADQAFYVSPQLEPIVPVGGPMLLPRLHRIFSNLLAFASGCFCFFRKKSPSAAPQVALLLVESAREWSPGGFLGDEVLSYLHNMLLPETVGSNRNPLLAMSWFWWWLLAGASQVVPATFCGQVLEDALWGLRFALATARCHHSVARGTSAGGKGKFPNRCWATT